MSAVVPPASNERENMMQYLRSQRDTFRYVAYQLSDDQARMQPTAGTLSIGGLIKHVANCERGWIDVVMQNGSTHSRDDTEFTMLAHETLDGLLADLEAVGAETEASLASLDMDTAVPVPDGMPWLPKDLTAWSVRWVLAHLIEEHARHAGHADIIREAIDGKTMYELQAMADGWHEQYLEMIANY